MSGCRLVEPAQCVQGNLGNCSGLDLTVPSLFNNVRNDRVAQPARILRGARAVPQAFIDADEQPITLERLQLGLRAFLVLFGDDKRF